MHAPEPHALRDFLAQFVIADATLRQKRDQLLECMRQTIETALAPGPTNYALIRAVADTLDEMVKRSKR